MHQFFDSSISTPGSVLNQHKKYLLAEKKRLERALAESEKEVLICNKNGKYYKWYAKSQSGVRYIPKSKRAYAEKLAKSTYNRRQLRDVKRELRAIDAYFNTYGDQERSVVLLENSAGYRELLGREMDLSEEMRRWQNEAYESNPFYPEELTVTSVNGQKVRSKSEALIAMALAAHGIPFRYECKLMIGQDAYYPDFTIRNPFTGEIVYWEHFGMMDNEMYAASARNKLRKYISYGLLPGRTLFCTYETRDTPLSFDAACKLVESMFM